MKNKQNSMPLKLKHKIVRSGGSLRILIPKAIRQQLNLKEGDTLEIWLDKNDVICMKKVGEK